ncbi:metallophosphoesterase [Colwellia ponticola]|uniref:3',5'-cyclic-nucleotide phosphodiesterase n=1 Tax=Colwellia ponticola TaxID=2304625 RepID=A0A8H2PN76_9GAMM|nr:metallophosphoesterase [Colwellia ponticola]TMM47506.1 3',5'-cyclic-nucleotide phosphodiesterase [Colwellia ponticola]
MTSTQSRALQSKSIVLAQITDSHLFSSQQGLHHGYNVYENLKKVLQNIANNPSIDIIVFTGDLTQDHSEQSYQNFVDCVQECNITVPIYYVAGNHDDPELLAKYFSVAPFVADKEINLSHWQVQLIDSKSATPAGYVSDKTLVKLQSAIKKEKHQLLVMHHHPIDVGYFIDEHGLQNKAAFWQVLNGYNNIKAIACGHVHGERLLTKKLTNHKVALPLYTCPATSIQFDPCADGVAALAKGPAYRFFYLHADGQLTTNVVYL